MSCRSGRANFCRMRKGESREVSRLSFFLCVLVWGELGTGGVHYCIVYLSYVYSIFIVYLSYIYNIFILY